MKQINKTKILRRDEKLDKSLKLNKDFEVSNLKQN